MHKLIHIDDFISFGEVKGIFDYNELMKDKEYRTFYL